MTYSQAELARMLGVSAQAVSKYSKEPGFPRADRDGLREAVPVFQWWIVNRAPKAIRNEVAGQLGLEVQNEPEDLSSESEKLDLRLKAHKVSKAIGDVVSFSDVRGIIGDLAREIRQACEKVNAATGRDVLPMFEEAFNRFEESLIHAQESASDPEAME